MSLFLGCIIGVIVTLMLTDKPIKIEITNKIEQHEMYPVPAMSEVLKKKSTEEDEAYEEMGIGEVLNTINNIMMGGDNSDKE